MLIKEFGAFLHLNKCVRVCLAFLIIRILFRALNVALAGPDNREWAKHAF
jgi:hypothetical protein